MNRETIIKPEPKLIWPFLAWNFGWTWSCWLLAILLKNLGPENPSTVHLTLELSLYFLSFFGPLLASLIVLKKRSFKASLSFIFSGKKDSWPYLLIFGGALIAIFVLAAGGRMIDNALVISPLMFIISIILSGGLEEFGWRGFLQPALEKKFSFLPASLITGIIWAIWHIPLWFYDRLQDRSQYSFPLFIVTCIILAIWLAALYKKTQSAFICNLFHSLFNTLNLVVIGISQSVFSLDFSQINPFFYLGGIAVLTLYSIYLGYQTDKSKNISSD